MKLNIHVKKNMKTNTLKFHIICKLKDDRVSTDDIQIKFRIVQALNENQIIIGLNEVQEHDLTKVFRH